MKKRNWILFTVNLIIISGCAITASATPAGPRTIVLDGTSYNESDLGGSISWRCGNYVNEGSTLVELGVLTNHKVKIYALRT